MKVVYYTMFAVFSICINLASQSISFYFYSGEFDVYVALLVGMPLGLAAKYALDKRYIFEHKTTSHKENGLQFMLYSFMGVFPTLIFWGTEIFFYKLFQTQTYAYIGGFIGLVIGYTVKYYLDKRFVFRDSLL